MCKKRSVPVLIRLHVGYSENKGENEKQVTYAT